MANELKYSDSPYLLQHKDNPVNWHPYSQQILDKAKKDNKLIFLSIGYSTCHWCHVMARESFENEKIAKILNKNFISIKIDREEMPDIDKYYQNIYQIMHNRGGGWPLTIIMTPDLKVFYSATYIPPHTSHFGVGLEELLKSISKDWDTNPQKIEKIANSLNEYLKNKPKKEIVKIDNNIIDKILNEANKNFDMKFGGIKGAPKFPMETTLDMLIDLYQLTNNKKLLENLNFTFEKMAKGGIFDQIDGGFYRYSTDEKWLIPHFEKMLYNNANLSIEYLKMYEITNNFFYKEVALRTIDEMLNRYIDKNGLFFSASNAESDGREGKYFVYEYDEVEPKFQEFSNKDELLNYFGIVKYGNFNGRNNPTINSEKPNNYKKALKILQQIREKREFPFMDTKKITSWNSMMISALLKVRSIDKKYKQIGLKTLNTLIQEMYQKGVLYHSYNKNRNRKTMALLEDYSYLIKALIDAYESSYNEKYLNLAKELSEKVEIFYNENWYMNQNKTVLAEFSDNAYASSLGILAQDFLRLATICYDYKMYQKGKNIIIEASSKIDKYPFYYPSITKAYLMDKKGIYVISSDEVLNDDKFRYPFVEFRKGQNYKICNIESCLKKSKNLEDIKKVLEK